MNRTDPEPMLADPEHIAISKSKGIRIDWKDGHRSHYSCEYLRDNCPCANCTGAHGSEPQPSSYSRPDPSPFPMFTPKIHMLGVEEVGTYAIRILWSDNHSAGIYSYEHFRNICPCEECRSARGEE
jgi:DUF971 family protein